MSAFPGSSIIPVYGTILIGPTGATGTNGVTGPTGSTGNADVGPYGPTGLGIISAAYLNSGITFTLTGGKTKYIQFLGSTGVSFIDGVPQSVVIGRGLTSGVVSLHGHSVLYSFVDSFVNNNKVVIQPNFVGSDPTNDELALKIRTFEANGPALVGISTDASYIYLVGKTFTNNRVGNTGEILYKSGSVIYAIDGSVYTSGTGGLLSVDMAADRHPIHNNQNVNTKTYDFSGQNLLGQTGVTGFAFFNVDYGSFDINNNNYQLNESTRKANTTLYLGVTGSDTLTFKFPEITFSQGASFTPQALTSENFGSCCFCQSDTTEINCMDYVSESYCSNVGGSFSTTACLDRISSGDCYAEGACCVNGKCINSSIEKCLQYKGTFFPGEICAASGNNSSSFACPATCASSNPDLGRCCFRGFCFDLTAQECSSFPGSVFTAGVACTSNTDAACCAAISGACCTRQTNGEYTCTNNFHPSDCDGIFHGPGSLCSEVECCGRDFIETYFNDSEVCKVTNNQPCLPIGTKMGGGYLVGVIGMPSPCSSYGSPLTAYGQPLACRVYPRGNVTGPNSYYWPFKNCGGSNGANLGTFGAYVTDVNFEYFVRTKSSTTMDLNYSNNALKRCLLKYGTPYIQQTVTDVTTIQGVSTTVLWGDNIQYVGSADYNSANGTFAYPIGNDVADLNYIISEKLSPSSPLYKYLAKQHYGEKSIHMLWALIVAPEDAYDDQNLSWGMEEGRARIGSYNSEPITTFGVDGLLSTRIFDESSKENPKLWFRDEDGISDTKAFDRFCFYNTANISKRSNWNFSVVESDVESNINTFKTKYSEMWDANNPQNSCTKQISILNQNSYGGYNDWYIPSIIELNYIFENRQELNSGILLGNGSILNSTTSYWSSTSIPYLKSWSATNHLDYSSYSLQESPSALNKNQKYRFIASDYSGLNNKTAYELSIAVAAGENMLVQVFDNSENSGLVQSINRKTGVGKLRPVRRIPIIVGCVDYNIEVILEDTDFSQCNSCPSGCTPEI